MQTLGTGRHLYTIGVWISRGDGRGWETASKFRVDGLGHNRAQACATVRRHFETIHRGTGRKVQIADCNMIG